MFNKAFDLITVTSYILGTQGNLKTIGYVDLAARVGAKFVVCSFVDVFHTSDTRQCSGSLSQNVF
jgi:hypothetical protein